MSKSPHTSEFRAKVSQEYLDGLGSYNYLATKYNIGCKTLKEWVAKYRINGIGAFIRKTGNAFTHPILKPCVSKRFYLVMEA